MCRFVMYLGPPATLASLTTEPDHSIIRQSFQAAEREEPLNGDGFGVGWYAPAIREAPAIFRDVSPAWNDENLRNIAPVIRSGCLLAHVRAATAGLPISKMNCHPFGWRRLAFMHNGAVASFRRVKRSLCTTLSDTAFDMIRGSTDTEHLFALFVDRYRQNEALSQTERLFVSLRQTIEAIEKLTDEAGATEPSHLNLAVTDGECAVVSRYSSDGRPPETLYVHTDRRYECGDGGEGRLVATRQPAVLIASEPLTDDAGWTAVEPNHAIVVDADRQTSLQTLSAC